MFGEFPKTRYDLNFAILSVPVCINPFFWLVAAALGWTDEARVVELMIWILCVFVSVLVHELGHALAAKRFGARDVRITLHGMGGQTASSARLSPLQRIIELLSGPLAGLLLLGLTFVIRESFSGLSHNPLFYFTTSFLIYINSIWSLFNLIPVLPLDGGQIVCELIRLKRPWDGIDIATKLSIGVSAIIAALFVVLALVGLVKGTKSGLWYPAIVFAVLAVMNFQMYKSKYFYEQNGQEYRPRNPWERDPDWWKS